MSVEHDTKKKKWTYDEDSVLNTLGLHNMTTVSAWHDNNTWLTTQPMSWATVLIDHVAHLRLSGTKSDTHESGTNEEDRIDRALLLYNEDHPKGSDFEILNCSNIVRSVPK
ncbi:hypothetical protein H257_15052 [Aphanomyces astaci]|uniref:Uncharacterized protein n=1 Tax=Aphanomyces astaci TaxID=112090 RepID=W4FRE8_APHAT|nr:hypothetical protein H257_15052 [Aphanomyces astaci]ETV69233.1 hypothetical protein H257_15052 [Aphanomyces astaci]|eukprot:XP_009841335.1 hypothetical protein H257_15052 [Aphanomyces astaci]